MTDPEQWRSDRRLVEELLAGSESARATFAERMRCIPRILAFHNARAGSWLSAEDVADLAGDVFERVWSRLAEFAGEATLETWVYRFCVFTLQNRLREAKNRRQRVAGGEALPEAAAPESGEVPEPDRAALLAAVERLEPEERRVVEMRIFEDLTFDAIAARLSQSSNTVKSRFYRGLERLRQWLKPAFGEEAA